MWQHLWFLLYCTSVSVSILVPQVIIYCIRWRILFLSRYVSQCRMIATAVKSIPSAQNYELWCTRIMISFLLSLFLSFISWNILYVPTAVWQHTVNRRTYHVQFVESAKQKGGTLNETSKELLRPSLWLASVVLYSI